MDSPELQRASQAVAEGKQEEARRMLAAYLQREPRSAEGWFLLSQVVDDPGKRVECARRAVLHDPTHAAARKRLAQLTEASAPAESPSGVFRRVPAFVERPAPAEPPSPPPPPPSPAEGKPTPEPGPPPAPKPKLEPLVQGAVPARAPARRASWGTLLLAGLACLCLVPAAFAGVSFLQGGLDLGALLQPGPRFGTPGATAVAAVTLPPSWTPTATQLPTLTPTITPLPTATPTRTQVPPNPTIVAEMQIIETQVSDIRGLSIEGGVLSHVVTKVNVRPILEAHFLANGGSEEEVHQQALVLSTIGLIKPTYDLYTNTLNGLTDAIGGFYFPWSDEIYVIGSRFAGIERWVYSHEYAHALVDQHYDLDSLGVYPTCQEDEQRCQAIRALVEGDATLAMDQWFAQYATPQDYLDIINYRPPYWTLPEQFPPPYAIPDSQFPYTYGLEFVDYLYRRGNWARVNRAYAELPSSTEQILHPERYLAREAPVPVAPQPLEAALGSEWSPLASNSLGEWMTYLLLGYGADQAAQLPDDVARRAADGWGGDRYQVYYHEPSQASVLVARWVWDSSGDATEFAQAMSDYQEERFRGARVDRNDGDCWEVNQQASCVFREARETLWIIAPDQTALNRILDLFPRFR